MSVEKLSVPGPGRTIFSSSYPIIALLKEVVQIIEEEIQDADILWCIRNFAPKDVRLGVMELTPSRVAWSLAALLCVYRVTHKDRAEIDVAAALDWFFQGSDKFYYPALLNNRVLVRKANKVFADIDASVLYELLPYTLDHHGFGTRRDVIKDASNIRARENKKKRGVYYTPSDVADYMISWAIGDKSLPTVLDPACGTGVFLLSAARNLVAKNENPLLVMGVLYGIDVDPMSVDLACFVLTCFFIPLIQDLRPWQIWHLLRLNFAVKDTLDVLQIQNEPPLFLMLSNNLEKREKLKKIVASGGDLYQNDKLDNALNESVFQLFPEVNLGFDVLVANPPYSALGARKDLKIMPRNLRSLNNALVTSTTNSFVPFIETMWTWTKQGSQSSMIVPMSIAYNSTSPFQSLRRAMSLTRGDWFFRFFDRTPDSIFGDDIKQRTAIVQYINDQSKPAAIWTSGITRWTSRSRVNLFRSQLPKTVMLKSFNITTGIPKIQTRWEQAIYELLDKQPIKLANWISSTSKGYSVKVGVTAYNYLALYRQTPLDVAPTTSNSLETTGELEADYLYALLVSRFTYWMWRVSGDGFHVPKAFLLNLPYENFKNENLHKQLAALGKEIWKKSQRFPVDSTNKGVRTRSFNTSILTEVDEVDKFIAMIYHIDTDVLENLRQYVTDTHLVGRGKEGA